MSDRMLRIKDLARRERGRRSAPVLFASLTEILGSEVTSTDVLDLDASDDIFRSSAEPYRALVEGRSIGFRRFFSYLEEKALIEKVNSWALHSFDQMVAMQLKPASDLGGILLPMNAALRHFHKLLQLDGDTFRIHALTGFDGLMIDWNPDEPEETFEVAVWGEHWPLRLL